MTMTTTSSRQWPLGQFRKHTMILVSELFQVPCFHSDHFFQCFLNPIDITFQVDLDCQSEISSWKLVNIIKRIQPNHSFSNSTALSLQINVLVFYADSEEHFFMQIRGAGGTGSWILVTCPPPCCQQPTSLMYYLLNASWCKLLQSPWAKYSMC